MPRRQPLVLAAALTMGFWVASQATADPRFEVIDADDSGITLHVEFPSPSVSTIHTAGGVQNRISLPGAGVHTELGAPDVPVIRTNIALPADAVPRLEVLGSEAGTWTMDGLGIDLGWLPVQAPVVKRPGAWAARTFERQEALYALDAFFPGELARLGEPGQQRGHRFVPLELFPVQPNPAAGQVQVARSLTLRVHFDGADWDLTEQQIRRYATPAFDPAAMALIRREDDRAFRSDDGGTTGYLIISDATFDDAVLPLAEFKRRQGYVVTVATLTETGSSAESIKAYIEEQYHAAPVPPAYVLLVGDTEQIPCFAGQFTGAATDLYYTTMDGAGDLHPDLLIGRFPANSVADVDLLVTKNLVYQLFDGSTDWIKNASFIASEDEYLITEGSHEYCIERWLAPDDYMCNRRYTVAHGATTDEVLADIDAGLSQLTFSGHGWVWGWLDGPPMTVADLPDLGNAGMLPLVQSYACETGMYEYDSFIERWVLAPNGAIASWGSSTASYFEQDDVLQRAVYDAMFGGQQWQIRGALNQGLWAVWSHYGGEGVVRGYPEQYNLMGDPSLDLWTAPPTAVDVTAVEPLEDGASQVTIQVAGASSGEPIAGALVCLYLGDRIHAAGHTGASGEVSLDFGDEVVEGEVLDLMVSGHDIQTHDGTIEVEIPEGGCQCGMGADEGRGHALAGILLALLAIRRRDKVVH